MTELSAVVSKEFDSILISSVPCDSHSRRPLMCVIDSRSMFEQRFNDLEKTFVPWPTLWSERNKILDCKEEDVVRVHIGTRINQCSHRSLAERKTVVNIFDCTPQCCLSFVFVFEVDVRLCNHGVEHFLQENHPATTISGSRWIERFFRNNSRIDLTHLLHYFAQDMRIDKINMVVNESLNSSLMPSFHQVLNAGVATIPLRQRTLRKISRWVWLVENLRTLRSRRHQLQ